MSLRIGFDMDGVLADFASTFREMEMRLFGARTRTRVTRPEEEDELQATRSGSPGGQAGESGERRQRSDAVWQAIRSTPGFWTTLKPLEAGAVRRIRDLMLRHHWEVFFITQRPATAGETVQRQTQRWLIAQGFDVPSVLVIGGSRGAAAGALRLHYHVDDSPQNCIDVMSDGRARPLLVLPGRDEVTAQRARALGIGVTDSIGGALDLLEQVSRARHQPGMLQKLAAVVGWKERPQA